METAIFVIKILLLMLTSFLLLRLFVNLFITQEYKLKRSRKYYKGSPVFLKPTMEYIGTFDDFYGDSDQIYNGKGEPYVKTMEGGRFPYYITTANRPWWHEIFFYKKVITREDNQPYLIRYSFSPFRIKGKDYGKFSKYFGLKIHKMVMSDDMCPHDHPWSFISFIFWGGYYEWRPLGEGPGVSSKELTVRRGAHGRLEYRRWKRPFSILMRRAKDTHRIELKEQVCSCKTCCNMKCGKVKHSYSLVFTGKVVRGWGFITKDGWKPWKDYIMNRKEYCAAVLAVITMSSCNNVVVWTPSDIMKVVSIGLILAVLLVLWIIGKFQK